MHLKLHSWCLIRHFSKIMQISQASRFSLKKPQPNANKMVNDESQSERKDTLEDIKSMKSIQRKGSVKAAELNTILISSTTDHQNTKSILDGKC